jgi:hypothetical protein
VQLVKRPGHPRFVLYVHPPADAGPNDDPVVLDLDPDTPLWLLRPADATRVGPAPESAAMTPAALAASAGLSAADAAAAAEAAGRPPALYDFELAYSRKQAEQAVKRASAAAAPSSSAGGGAGASSGGAPNPFAGGGSSGGGAGGVLGKLFGCFKRPDAAVAPSQDPLPAPAADPAAAARANETAAAAVAASGVQPGTPRTPQSLARIKAALAHAGVPAHRRVRLAFEDEVLAKTWHSLVALTLGVVSADDAVHARAGAARRGGGTQSSLASYQ